MSNLSGKHLNEKFNDRPLIVEVNQYFHNCSSFINSKIIISGLLSSSPTAKNLHFETKTTLTLIEVQF